MSVTPSPASAFPGDRPITDALLRDHKLNADEYDRILRTLGRMPSYTELGVFSVMWSEHCSYKSSRVHLRRLVTTGPRVLQGPGENAGVVDIGDGFCAVFKMESHNHPSFIEPHQGAATGVGGILRDIFTMGARPVASLNSLRFGRFDHPRTPELVRGVVEGIGGYGNAFGVPTVGGEVMFDARYDGNILVNAFTCGVARSDRLFYGRASGVGNPILYIGAKTGRDGIHGATMASDEFAAAGPGGGGRRPAMRSTMQVGDPFMGKLLLEACLELFEADVLEGIQDMGAAGLTSSSVEMAGRANNGIEIDLDRIPRRAKKMLPYEILLSESQERMLLVAQRGKEQRVLDICKKWELDAAVIGRVTDSRRWVVRATPGFDPLDDAPAAGAESVVVCDLPICALTDEAPVYDRPQTVEAVRTDPASNANKGLADVATFDFSPDWVEEIIAMCGSPNLGSRRAIWEKYDHVVRGGTVVRPGSDAAVVRVPCEKDGTVLEKFLAFSCDANGRWCELDPWAGGALAVAEACRNIVCSGAEPIGLTDCLNFGNPERPEIMHQFARAIDGIADACRALGVPVVSGNVSLYNETAAPTGPVDTDGGGQPRHATAILPTPTIGAVGLFASPDDRVTQWFKRAGDVVILLGDLPHGAASLGGSEYLAQRTGQSAVGQPPRVDLDKEARLQRLVLALARRHVLSSAHDVSEGGLAIALAECCTTSPEGRASDKGARIDLELDPGVDVPPALAPSAGRAALPRAEASHPAAALEVASRLFGEHPACVVVSVHPGRVGGVLDAAKAAGVHAQEAGVTGGDSLSIALATPHHEGLAVFKVPLRRLREAREACLSAIWREAHT